MIEPVNMARSPADDGIDGVTDLRRRSGDHLPAARAGIDSNAARWVLAATVAFWLALFVVGSHFF